MMLISVLYHLVLEIYSLQNSFCGGRLVAHNLMILLLLLVVHFKVRNVYNEKYFVL